jgi:hypothetical protein
MCGKRPTSSCDCHGNAEGKKSGKIKIKITIMITVENQNGTRR